MIDAIAPWQEPTRTTAAARATLATIRGLRGVGVDLLEFSVDNILRSARRYSRLEDFGDRRFLDPLELRADFYRQFDGFSKTGQLTTFGSIVGPLVNRARVVDHLARNPEVLNEAIDKPFFIAGLPRTGTTLLYNLLAQDDAARPLLTWESMRPTPHPRARTGRTDPRIKAAKRAIAKVDRAVPGFRKVHPIDPEGPEECLSLLAIAQINAVSDHRDTAFREWSESAPMEYFTAGYREYKSQLQILQSQRRGQRWLLKCPMHMYALPSLMEVFPDATIIQTHRDPAKSLPSLASLVAVMHRVAYERVDLTGIGEGVARHTALLLERSARARSHSPQSFVDVRYHDLVDDPIATVERIYEQRGLELTDGFRRKMQAYIAANPRGKHGGHHYSAADFELDPAALRDRFSDYVSTFDIPSEATGPN